MNAHDDQALARAIEHRRTMRQSLHAERRCKGVKPAASRRRAILPTSAAGRRVPTDRLDEVREIVVKTWPAGRRVSLKMICETARCSPQTAQAMRDRELKAGSWPYVGGRARSAGD
jgi:hypothetical protein